MDYIQLHLSVSPREPFAEVLAYRLAEAGFEMFEETETGFKAYISCQQYDEDQLLEVIRVEREKCDISWNVEIIPWKNWNEEWESNFQPEVIASKVYVRAEFHPPNPGYEYELIVQPRMAFGTGHHPTTSQVMEMMLEMDFKGKKILDMGSGTGILALLALFQGAASALAIDNDSNAVENTAENAIRNGFPEMVVLLGDATTLTGNKFDIILANINRNIILNDIALYESMLNPKGSLVTSGYYLQDLQVIREKANSVGFNFHQNTVKNEWCCASFIKK